MITPMMSQYLDIKEKYKDCIVLFRLGDFYEMFFEDAKIASKELELVLTGRECGLNEKAPMCGIPFVASPSYINKLINKGFKVAICEQIEDANSAKGIVKRDVVKIITPGTYFDESANEIESNIFLSIIYYDNISESFGLTFGDITTGEVYSTIVKNQSLLMDELMKFSPKEIIINSNFNFDEVLNPFQNDFLITEKNEDFFENINFNVSNFSKIKTCNKTQSNSIIGFYNYVLETQKISLSNIKNVELYEVSDFLLIDKNSKNNLELVNNIYDKTKKHSLYWVLNKTNTPMGSRLLKQWIERPLLKIGKIIKRQESIEELKNNFLLHSKIKDILSTITDIDRIISKISSFSVSPKEIVALKNCIKNLPDLKKILIQFNSPLFKDIYDNFDVLDDIFEIIDTSISEDAGVSLKDGSILKDGLNKDIDELRYIKSNVKETILEIEQREREITKIKSLKIGYNKIFGYYIEISKSNYDLIPKDRYIRKQTLANSERYINEELKVLEEKILNAEDKLSDLEYKLYVQIRDQIEKDISRLKNVSKHIAIIDVLLSLTTVSIDNNYVKPEISDDGIIEIDGGRHPVVEKLINKLDYISNDIYLNNFEEQLHIITGPNMAGKSTFMRQVALITIMAQMGSFVPADTAKISICDKIFTRIGASDDLSSGRSTFMVEMSEVAYILNNFTQNSLIILDEVGRGTSTYDGVSIAYGIIEYLTLISKIRPKTLFATHYHELTKIENVISNVKNYSVSAKKMGDSLIFSRKVVKGAVDDSYGIEVAKLAGINQEIINVAKNVLENLEKQIEYKDVLELNPKCSDEESSNNSLLNEKLDMFLQDIINTNILNETPVSALSKLNTIIENCKRLMIK